MSKFVNFVGRTTRGSVSCKNVRHPRREAFNIQHQLSFLPS
jgi:hypothetical protein